MNFVDCVNEIESLTSPTLRRDGHAELRKVLTDNFIQSLDFFNKHGGNRVVLVAGTNGKGSVCATLSTLLKDQGYRVGMFTSPHLINICERLQIDGQNISEQDFVLAYIRAKALAGEYYLTRFEMLTLMALIYFVTGEIAKPCDYLVIEVGMGGLRDATRAIPHKYNIIATISEDHREILGNTVAEIAYQKLSVVDKDGVCVHLPFSEEVLPVFESLRQPSQEWIECEDFEHEVQQYGHEPIHYLKTNGKLYQLSLAGKRGAVASSLALTLLKRMGFALAFEQETLLNSLKNVNWPGRMQKLSDNLYVSGDHNPEGVQSLIEILKSYRYEKLYIIFGAAKDKDHERMLSLLKLIPRSEVILTQTPFKGLNASGYEEWINQGLRYFDDYRQAMQFCVNKSSLGDKIIVTGSLYLVGEVLKDFSPKSEEGDKKCN